MTRNAGRGVVLAVALIALGLGGCKGGDSPAAAAKAADTPEAAARPDAVFEPLTIDTAKGPVAFQVEIADDEAERERGLMYRTALAPDRGMLFAFEGPAPRAFWMKNTYIPLDIIYIGADGRIVSIVANAEPFNETPLPSGAPALGVLEIYGGRAAQLGLKAGDRVHHRIFPK
ncbi:MAG: DUF192 domain-containing protein [Pseudomonadota bacterium]